MGRLHQSARAYESASETLHKARAGPLPVWLATAMLAVAYWATGALTLSAGESLLYPYRAVLWPPTGVALAVMLLAGRRTWPGVALGSVALGLSAGAALPWHVVVAVTLSNLVTVLLAASALARRPPPWAFLESPAHAASFVALGAGLAALSGALLGTLAFSLSGVTYMSDFVYVAWAWWSGDAMSILVITPWLIAWLRPAPAWSAATWGWFAVLLAGLAGVGLAVFGGWLPLGEYNYPLSYLPILLVVWFAFRFGPRGATSAVLLLVVIAIAGTLNGYGPFVRASKFETSILLQSFLAMVAITMLVLIAFVAAAGRAERELLRNQLALEQAHELDRLKGDFLSTMSHELRTPLTAVIAYAELLQDGAAGPLTDRQQELLAPLSAGAERLAQLMDMLLEYAWLAAGKFDLACGETDVVALLRSLKHELADAASLQGVKVELSAPVATPCLHADAGRLAIALRGVLDNAIRFSRPGGKVELSVAAADHHLEVAITDQGVGISREALAHVFEPFFQAEPMLTREHGGAGLGLALARGIVEAHGGSITVESTPGHGARFTTRLPLRAPCADPASDK